MTTLRAGSRALPLAAAAALAVAMLLIAGLVAMATGLRDTADEQAEVSGVIEAIAAESAAVTNGYFSGPESVAHVVASSLERDPSNDDVIDLLRNLTESQPNVDGTFVGYPDGSFIDVRREIEAGSDGFRVKTIQITDRQRTVKVEIIKPELGMVDSFSLPDDIYDPRNRPWYAGVQRADEHWTEPYVFFTSNEPGITYSVPVRDETGASVAVVGVDIRLADLQEFLAGRRPSANGGAAVVNSEGELVAGTTQLLDGGKGALAIDRLLVDAGRPGAEELAPVRVEGEVSRVVVGRRIGAGGSQLLIVDAPEDDFLQGIRSSRRGYALLATTLGLAGILLLGLGAGLIGRYLSALGKLARTDPLTGLLNRAALSEEMSTALGDAQSLAVMAIDLDDFKLVNDQFGHEGGDRALTRVAHQLVSAAPADALVGRLGGDEFCIVLIDSLRPAEVLRSVIHAAAGQVEADGYTFDLELSAGFTMSNRRNPETAAELFRLADTAMYEAKARKGTTIIQFDEAMHLQWHRDDERKAVLQAAIANDELEVHFQPEFDLVQNIVVGAEALLRWQHPNHGLIMAVEFIEDLEQFGLLPDLLNTVFSAAERLAACIPRERPFVIRLNMSDTQLLDPSLITRLERLLEGTNVTLSLEVSEQTMIGANPKMQSVFERIQRTGTQIALDNFGIGSTSLAELQTLPVDLFKIDRLFVDALGQGDPSKSIAAVLSNLADVLKIEIVAEGIETKEQQQALLSIGCNRGQGYLLGRPVHIDEFIEKWSSKRSQPAA